MRWAEESQRLLEGKGWCSSRLRAVIDLSIVMWERKVEGYELRGEGRFYKEGRGRERMEGKSWD